MRRKIYLTAAYIIISLNILGMSSVPTGNINNTSDRILGGADEIEVDLLNDTVTSQSGVNVKYGDLKLKVFDMQRDKEKNRAYLKGNIITQVDQPTGILKLESTNGDVSLDGDQGVFYNNFGYLEIGKVTGGEAPNDKIYFGGKVFEYANGNLYINNGWLTTDYNVVETADPNQAGYHLLSKEIIVEPDKQLTLKGSDLYLGDNDIFPFSIPWYRVNIRQDSEVPLFPEWGTKDYYGWQTSWGVLYGDKDSKFKGGFAPKFADQMGLLIGRWENWYKTDKFGTAKLNIDDALIWSKADKKDNATDPEKLDYEEKNKRYRLNYTHEYSGEKGTLYFNAINGTYNMIPKLDDLITDYAKHGNRFGDFAGEIPTYRPRLDSTISFFSMNSDLKELGPDKDITLKTRLKLTDDKEAYAYMVYDDIDDIDYGSNIDNDLYSQIELYKDNSRYRVGGYYNYLYDMDPGSTLKDTQSRAEDFGFEFFEKKNNIGFSYDEKNGDKFRKLGLWERDPNLDSMIQYNSLLGTRFNYSYNPSTIREYSQYDSRDLRVSFGDYDFWGDYRVKAGYNINEHERKLDLMDDPLRKNVVGTNTSAGNLANVRDREYNRFENIIYSDFREERAYVDFYNDTTKFTFATGQTKEKFWDRDGIYYEPAFSVNSYRQYVNESKFYEFGAERNEIPLGAFGELALFGGVRYDKYDKGYNPYTRHYTSGEDSTLRTQLKLNHTIQLFDNTENKNRKMDFALSNDLNLFYQRYDYDSGDVKFGTAYNDIRKKTMNSEDIRLKNKDNIYEIKDTINAMIGNTETAYNIEYKRRENPADTSELNGQTFKNDVNFKIDDRQSLSLNYGQDRQYTSENERDRNYNDLTFRNYGAVYNYEGHRLSYQNQGIDSKIWDMKNVDNAKEKIRANTYAYQYSFGDNRLGFDFSQGTDVRKNYSLDLKEIDVDNKIYGVSFLDGGDVENYYRVTYEDYKHKEDGAKVILDGKRKNINNSDVLSFTYEYRDKRFTDEELKKYAELEFNKDSNQLTQAELYRVRDILRDRERNSVNFNLNSIMYDRFNSLGDYKRNFKIHLMMQRNDARYDKTGDLWDSLEEVKARIFYSQNRVGFGYEIEENSGWDNNNKWGKDNREHKISLMAKIGKPSEGWNVKTYAKFYENFNNTNNKNRKSSLDGLGVEIGKEFGYYEWAVAYEREYAYSTQDYEWRVALQFTLLAFPDKPIFGLGADTDAKQKTSPQTYLFDGLKPQDIVD
ncbi:hypothetical protein [Fusobacterium ulcerans]|uniref:hypothetical protein n=1 Tax=Fusobacterium ulcerans TaxID=861 RepID=UPI002E790CBF|nr:hypothetical protein [Fusobacterium ulcerans]MEE0138435.1 hypothetical protein [Fusobacterium ulcerans]